MGKSRRPHVATATTTAAREAATPVAAAHASRGPLGALVTPSGGERLLAMDGLRALAIIGVLFAHLPMASEAAKTYTVGFGDMGVDLFFALSAYLLSYPLFRSGRTLGLGQYYLRRVVRIMPTYLLAVIATLLVVPEAREASKHALVANVLLFQTLNSEWESAVIASAWFLAPLAQFYLIFPLLFGIVRRTKGVGLTLLLVAGTAALATLFYPHAVFYPEHFDVGRNLPFLSLVFLVGLLGAYVAARSSRSFPGALAIGLVGIIVHAMYLRPFLDYEPTLRLLMLRGPTACACCLLVVLGAGPKSRGLLVRALSWGPLRMLGAVSYGAFLFHYPLRWALFNCWSQVACTWTMIPLSLLLGTASYFLIEAPVMRAAARWTRRPTTAQVSARH